MYIVLFLSIIRIIYHNFLYKVDRILDIDNNLKLLEHLDSFSLHISLTRPDRTHVPFI